MADIYFSRDTKVFLHDGTVIYEIPVLDGYSFSQATNTTEVTLAEAAAANGDSRRGRKMFTDSFAPLEWSFATYVRPYTDSSAHGAVEQALWSAFNAAGSEGGITSSATSLTVNFDENKKTVVGTFDLYFRIGESESTQIVYKLEDCCVNEASIDFELDALATINWSGSGKKITEVDAIPASPTPTTTGIAGTNNFIRNKITSLAITDNGSGGTTYGVTLTGGNLTFTNNLTYLVPEVMGTINQPIGHVTGAKVFGGSFTAYLNGTDDGTAELFEDLMEETTDVTNSHSLTFSIGGASAPNLVITFPTAHLEVPTHSIDDAIGIECNFHGLPSDLDNNDEVTMVYKGVAP